MSGYILHTLPVALHAWLCYPNSFTQATQSLIRCGGDTDSTASLLGIWMGAQWGAEAVPAHWLGRLQDPLACSASLYRIAQCAVDALSRQEPHPAPRPLFALRLLRNLGFLALVVAHIVRRTLPPY